MSITAGDNLFIEEELKIVVIGEPSTGKVLINTETQICSFLDV